MASFASFSVPDNHAHIPEGNFAPVLYGGTLPYELPAVEEKFGEQNFRVLNEMRILAKIRLVILDLVG